MPLDKRNAKGRFSWVRRLVQGQNRQGSLSGSSQDHYRHRNGNQSRRRNSRGENGRVGSSSVHYGLQQQGEDGENTEIKASAGSISSYNSDENHNRGSLLSDGATSNSDNISTIPLKSMVSSPSTRAPSVLSGYVNADNSSYVASTAETSLAPSIQAASFNHSLYPNVPSISQTLDRDRERDRDEELIITLASSSRRARRRSLDTNCSTAGIPPASIVERLAVNPTAGNSSAASVHYERGDGQSSSHYERGDGQSSGHYERSVKSEAEYEK